MVPFVGIPTLSNQRSRMMIVVMVEGNEFNNNSRLLVGGEDYNSGGGHQTKEEAAERNSELGERRNGYIYVRSFGESWTARVWGVEPFPICHRWILITIMLHIMRQLRSSLRPSCSKTWVFKRKLRGRNRRNDNGISDRRVTE
jgi:hypothetical protein